MRERRWRPFSTSSPCWRATLRGSPGSVNAGVLFAPLAWNFSIWHHAALWCGLVRDGATLGIRRQHPYLSRALSRQSGRAVFEARGCELPDRAEGLPVERRRRNRRDAQQGGGRFRREVEDKGPGSGDVLRTLLGRRNQTRTARATQTGGSTCSSGASRPKTCSRAQRAPCFRRKRRLAP